MVERAVHFGLQLAGVHVGQLEEIVPLTMETVVLGADAVVVAQNFLYLDAGEDGQKFVLGRKVCDMQRVAALGVKVVLELLGRGDDGEVDIRPDVDEPVHRKLLHIGSLRRVGDQQNANAALYL